MDSNRILHVTSSDQHIDDHLADKLGVVDDVELLPGEELLAAHEAGEALQVEHLAMQIQQKEDGKLYPHCYHPHHHHHQHPPQDHHINHRHLVAGLPDQVLRTYALPTPTALCSKSPEEK